MKTFIKTLLLGSLLATAYSTHAKTKDELPKCSADAPACLTGLTDTDFSKHNTNLANAKNTLDAFGKVVFDFDRDGCLASSPIVFSGNNYKTNPGLPAKDGNTSGCIFVNQLDNANVLYKIVKAESSKDSNNNYYAKIFSIYTVKDLPNHSHDLEHVVLWIKENKQNNSFSVDEVGVSAHGKLPTKVVKDVPKLSRYSDDPDFNTFTIVYHKDGGSTHALRNSKSVKMDEFNITYNDEGAENPTEKWWSPAKLINVDYTSDEFKSALASANWGSATSELKTDDAARSFLQGKLPGNWKKQNVKFK